MTAPRFAAGALLTVATVSVMAGTATATPESDVAYTVEQVGRSVVVTTTGGAAELVDGQFQITAQSGRVLARLPLSYQLGDRRFPIEAQVSGDQVALTPITDPARATTTTPRTTVEAVAAQDRTERERAAFLKMEGQIRFAAMIGTIIGAVVSSAVGCVIGGVVAVPTAVLTAVFGPLAGCVAGALVLAPVGALGGTLLLTAPVALGAAFQYFVTISAP
ncbi:hypothetical protein [Nocardia sp. NPDC051832]|uniref:hypothetical protein n=1 Tax=Nocardia sp. NPDC051832 TaxID=3155673 RepID=UPI003429A66D